MKRLLFGLTMATMILAPGGENENTGGSGTSGDESANQAQTGDASTAQGNDAYGKPIEDEDEGKDGPKSDEGAR